MRTKILLSILLMIMPFYFGRSQNFTYIDDQGVKFKCKLKDGAVTIKSFDQDALQVTIPSKVKYQAKVYAVTQIDTYISGNNYAAEIVKIPFGIERIANYSFYEFRKIKEVHIPDYLKKISTKAFRNDVKFVDVIYDKQTEKVKEEFDDIAFVSDIDLDVPESKDISESTYCVILATENYDKVANVEYAIRDGESFYKYCRKTLGVPEENIRFFVDATYANMIEAFDFLKDANAKYPVPGQMKIMLYYAGHGFVSESNKETFIVPKDGNPKKENTCYRLNRLYKELEKLDVSRTLVVLDACFTGMQRGKDTSPLISARTIAMAPKKDTVDGKLIVFSATSNDETALSYRGQQHGLFTYYFLKELKKTKGDVTLGELTNKVCKDVGLKSVTINDKHQTPWVNVSASLYETWKNMNIK